MYNFTASPDCRRPACVFYIGLGSFAKKKYFEVCVPVFPDYILAILSSNLPFIYRILFEIFVFFFHGIWCIVNVSKVVCHQNFATENIFILLFDFAFNEINIKNEIEINENSTSK